MRQTTNRTISRELGIIVSTVEQHLTRVYRELNVRSRAELPSGLPLHPAGEITEVLPLSGNLVATVVRWNERLQSTYVPEQPRDSGFDESAEYASSPRTAREPARRLKREVTPGIRVRSESSVGSGELIEL